MKTLFSDPNWRPQPGVALQGLWLRWCAERPCPVYGWVAVLDSAILHDPLVHHHPWWDSTFQHARFPGAIIGDAFQRIPQAWEVQAWKNHEVATIDELASDLSTYAAQWVGKEAVKGWPTDAILWARTLPLSRFDLIRDCVEHMVNGLQDAGYPDGQGWSLPVATSGREPERLARLAPAHAKIAAHKGHGHPQRWDTTTMRLSLALTAYATCCDTNATSAWIAT